MLNKLLSEIGKINILLLLLFFYLAFHKVDKKSHKVTETPKYIETNNCSFWSSLILLKIRTMSDVYLSSEYNFGSLVYMYVFRLLFLNITLLSLYLIHFAVPRFLFSDAKQDNDCWGTHFASAFWIHIWIS